MTTLLMTIASLANPVPETWVQAVEQIESGGRGAATPKGDGGKAVGPYQFHKEAWADCSKVRKAAGLSVHPYSKASDPGISRDYAKTWLTHLRHVLTKEIGRPANAAETWLAYNLGMTGFRAFGFQWAFVPSPKFDKAMQVLIYSNRKSK
jgi:hypothetical protein